MNELTTSSRFNSAMNAVKGIQQRFQSSQTAQALVANAPVFLSYFKELKMYQMDCQSRLAAIAQQQQAGLDKYRDSAPRILNEMSESLKCIRELQSTVRAQAPLSVGSEEARTVIHYANQQIDQNIAIFNTLTHTLLSL